MALVLLLSGGVVSAAIVADVRAALARQDLTEAERIVRQGRPATGSTPEWLQAHSWLGRGALAAKQYDRAIAYAAETRRLVNAFRGNRPLDADPNTPIALGASMEVTAQAMAAQGQRSEAVALLQRELAAFRDTSIRTRIQKNLHLLSLEGQVPPAFTAREHLGPPMPSAEALRGRPVLLFFWAHWCPDCKQQVPALARLMSEMPELVVVGPTQRYGYVAGGEEAPVAEETRYIDEVRRGAYAPLAAMPVPVSEELFKRYGASTTPTLVLIGRDGKVAMYHPGRMSYEELAERVGAKRPQ